jgi:hypothetical protein
MGHRVLVIQDAPNDRRDFDIIDLLPAGDRNHCAKLPWSAVQVEDLAVGPGRLVVGVAESRSAEAVDFFRRRSCGAHNKLCFAVLPREIDPQLLQSASEFLDDFAIISCIFGGYRWTQKRKSTK